MNSLSSFVKYTITFWWCCWFSYLQSTSCWCFIFTWYI